MGDPVSILKCLSRILAVALAVIWLPVTAHCELEAIGAFAHEQAADEGCCDPTTGCTDDACEMIEGANLLPASVTVKAPAATAMADDLLTDHLFQLQAVRTLPVSPPVDADGRPPCWTPTWHFEQRAAGLARAPSVRV